jgi:GNAT superfamily N-acetyltransferase
MIVIHKALTADKKREFARNALIHNLFHVGWMLEAQLRNIDNLIDIMELTMAFDDKLPVGVSIYFKSVSIKVERPTIFSQRSVLCYVAPSYRRQGIGTKLLTKFHVNPQHMISYNGEPGSPDFYMKIGTDYRGWFYIT